VMMASPDDLEDFAAGFSLSEGLITAPADITALEIIPLADGIECRVSLVPSRTAFLAARRRHLAGPAGCGLCGIDGLHQALRPLPKVASPLRVSAWQIADVLKKIPALQILNQATHGVHAAAFCDFTGAGIILREDIGRHNALDKVIGALARRGADPARGAVFLTSRVSIELIQKTAIAGIPVLAAVSVPSARAVREAEACGITLVAVARDDGFEVMTHPGRIDFGAA
jgi:FdhD protein